MTVRIVLFFASVLLIMSSPTVLLAAEWYVNASVPSSSGGTTWETAFKTVQEGIDAASHGDAVTVAEGTYVENIEFRGKSITLTSTDPIAPDVVDNTVIDGNQAGSVVTFAGTEDETCLLSGFTIRYGNAEVGGGIFGGGTHATVQNNIIAANSADSHGGGIAYCDGLVENNVIRDNLAGGYEDFRGIHPGQGAGLAHCHGRIRDNVIAHNVAGGGMYFPGDYLGVAKGGGLYDCDGLIENNLIGGNMALDTVEAMSEWIDPGEGGGLAYCDGLIENNLIRRNEATDGGGFLGCNGHIRSNLIVANLAWYHGGGLHSCSSEIINNTVISNRAVGGYDPDYGPYGAGGGLHECNGAIQNCIIWDNTAPEGSQLLDSAGPTYSCIQDWTDGDGNIGADPVFMTPGHWDDNNTPDDPWDDAWIEGDYRLRPDSPCINSGQNQHWMANAVDLDGNPRVLNATVDMGAYEFVADEGFTWYVDATVAESGGGTTWETAFKTIQEAIDAAGDGDTVLVAKETYVENINFKGKNIVLQGADRSAAGWMLSYTIEVDFTPLSGEETRVLYARANSSDNYRVDFWRDSFRLTMPALGNHWTTRSFSGGLILSHGQTYHVKIEVYASVVMVSLDGYPLINQIWANSQPLGDGMVGLGTFSGASDFDNLMVRVHSPSPRTMLFEGFDDGVADGFTEVGGEWAVVDGKYVQSTEDPGGPYWSWVNARDLTEYAIIDGNEAGSVVTFAGTEDESCVLSGFAIQGGQAEDGGGICGGLSGRHTRATIQDNIIQGNSATDYGGGLAFCDGTIQNNTITGNEGGEGVRGGGLSDCDGIIRNNTITRNSVTGAGTHGGGLYGCDGTIQNNTISRNNALRGGGLYACNGMIRNNMIIANSGIGQWPGGGGGLAWCEGTIRNNLIAGNKARGSGDAWGGGLFHCNGEILNNTIVANSAYPHGEGGALSECTGIIQNCIIWGNTAASGPQIYDSSVPTYSCIEGWTAGGEGNIATNPQFVKPGYWDDNGTPDSPRDDFYIDGDYHLQPSSPCIDGGQNGSWMWAGVDADGNPRIFYGKTSKTVDMGAYEYGSWPFKVLRIGKAAGGETELTWNSRGGDTYVVWSRPALYYPPPTSVPWTQRATLSSQGLITSWTVPATSYDRCFYRVELKP